MIRGFDLLCKINFEIYSISHLFQYAMTTLDVQDYNCPKCGTRHPNWTKHDSYSRFLIGFHKRKVDSEVVCVIRYRCQSCRSTHAFLPEFVIPFKSHSLFFVLAVLKDLFIRSLTVNEICTKYDISVATLYAWKKAFLKDKKLWLGILEDMLTSISKFLNFLAKDGIKYHLRRFFAITNRSFFQTRSQFITNCIFTPD